MQLLLDQNRYEKISKEASHRGISVAAVIRKAIDSMPTNIESRKRAIRKILAAAPMSLPEDPQDLRKELDKAHDRIRP